MMLEMQTSKFSVRYETQPTKFLL